MPALPPPSALLGSLIPQTTAADASPPVLAVVNDTTTHETFDVICAWPVSGQYGPGSRILYYVLVAACVFGRGSAWLKSACLAAALLLPALAALHGIVLAAIHVDGAVDMDVYGAFQLCAIGVLAGPVTVRHSDTYFNTPGRNLIFLWTTMILAGLLSLTVEFFRATPVSCPAGDFTYGEDACGLTCSVDGGPSSPLRGGAQNNIYVIRAPDRLSFGTATLLAAACCIPAILSLVSTWNKILKINWKKRFGDDDDSEVLNAPIAGTNDATPAKMSKVNERIRFYLNMVEIPVFGAAVLAILIVGEMNFFSHRVAYMTEPIASVGQWSPIVGTGLAALGSLYSLLAADVDGPVEPHGSDAGGGAAHHCACSSHLHEDRHPHHLQREEEEEEEEEDEVVVVVGGPGGVESDRGGGVGLSRQETYQTYETYQSSVDPLRRASRQLSLATTRDTFGAVVPGRHHHHHHHHPRHLHRAGTEATAATGGVVVVDAGSRHKVAGVLEWLGEKVGTPAPDAFDDSDFRDGLAANFPTVPGEKERNPILNKIELSYNPRRDSGGNATPLHHHRQRSRAGSFAGSFAGSVASGLGIEGLPEAAAAAAVAAAAAERDAEGGGGPGRASVERPSPRARRDTLEVPRPAYHSPAPRRDSSLSAAGDEPGRVAVDDMAGQDPSSPTIRVFPECDS